jgi:hypothetical protein
MKEMAFKITVLAVVAIVAQAAMASAVNCKWESWDGKGNLNAEDTMSKVDPIV